MRILHKYFWTAEFALVLMALPLTQPQNNKNLSYYSKHESEILPDAKIAFQNSEYKRAIELCNWYFIIVGDSAADALKKDAGQCNALSRDMKDLIASGRMGDAREKARQLFLLNSKDTEATSVLANGPSTGIINDFEWVNMGLSVRWATCNVGASSSRGQGGYFAWGETTTKDTYTWSNYVFRISGDSDETVVLNKYVCFSSFSDYNKEYDQKRELVDNKRQLELTDDAANRNWGGSWRMPTVREMWELTEFCKWTWDSNNDGYIITSNITGNSIFLPANFSGGNGYYWTSDHNGLGANLADCLGFNPDGFKLYQFLQGGRRFSAQGIRPVTE